MKRYYMVVSIVAVGSCISLLLLKWMPKTSSLTYVTPNRTGYVRVDLVSFGVMLGVSALICLWMLRKQPR